MRQSVPWNSFATLHDVYAQQQGAEEPTDTLCNAHDAYRYAWRSPKNTASMRRTAVLSSLSLYLFLPLVLSSASVRLVIAKRSRELIRTIGRLVFFFFRGSLAREKAHALCLRVRLK